MEKEMNEKKKTKSITKKAKKIRSIVMMSLLCVLMLSAATYAWFTLSKTAKVASLTMTVGEATGLQIAPNKGSEAAPDVGDYSGVLIFGDNGTTFGTNGRYKITGQLLPATTADGISFSEPVYDDEGKVKGITPTTDKLDNTVTATNETGYYYETSFYLKSLGKDTSVQLRNATKSNDAALDGDCVYVEGLQGTYVLDKNADDQTNKKSYSGSTAIRICLLPYTKDSSGNYVSSGDPIVYEPNNDISQENGTKAEDNSSATAISSTSVQGKNGTFSKQDNKLQLTADTNTLIRMRIWVEGTDDECVNEINLKNIAAQLQFEEVTP